MLIDRRTVIIGAATLAAVRTAESVTPDTVEAQMNSPTERVLGIGGLFFRSRDPKKLAQWYQLNLGIDHRVWQQAAGPTGIHPLSDGYGLFRIEAAGVDGELSSSKFRRHGRAAAEVQH